MITCLLLGANGQLGRVLTRRLSRITRLHALGSRQLDIRDDPALAAVLARYRPALIINCAAMTAVDAAETDQDTAFAVNARAPGRIAARAAVLDIPLIHFSTDYVFDGAGSRPYRESDPTTPINVYGTSKLAGEQAVTAAGGPHLILRTGWLYARDGRNFVNTVLERAARGEALTVVDDQTGSPTAAEALADGVAALLSGLIRNDRVRLPRKLWGTYHATCAGSCTWYDLAARVLARRGLETDLSPIATRDYPTAARRPRYSVLDNARLQDAFTLALPDWEAALDATLVGPDLYASTP